MPFKKTLLTSLDNPKIKDLARLRDCSYRRKSKLFLIEGLRELKLALGSDIEISGIYFCPELLLKRENDFRDLLSSKGGIPLTEVSSNVYSKISFGRRKEGVIAVAKQPRFSLEDIKLKDNSLLVILESLEKPGNLGAVMRTIDAAGADALIVADPLTDIFNPNVVRSSIGTLFTVKAAQDQSIRVLEWLRKNNIKIICASPESKNKYTSFDFRGPCAIVLGSEEKGVSKLWRENADMEVSIPMRGAADSLNVSIAAAVLIFEAARQRSA